MPPATLDGVGAGGGAKGPGAGSLPGAEPAGRRAEGRRGARGRACVKSALSRRGPSALERRRIPGGCPSGAPTGSGCLLFRRHAGQLHSTPRLPVPQRGSTTGGGLAGGGRLPGPGPTGNPRPQLRTRCGVCPPD